MKVVGFTQDAVIHRGMHSHEVSGHAVMQCTDEQAADLARSLGSILVDLTTNEISAVHGVYVQAQRIAPFFIATCPYEHDDGSRIVRSTGMRRQGLGASGWIEETVWLGGSCNFCGGSGRLVF